MLPIHHWRLFLSGRIAQSVERWSNKPLVMGSIPIVPILLCKEKDTMRGDRTRDQSIKSRTLYRTELARLMNVKLGDWSSGMILA
jgi:hypothetical protein